MASSSKKDKPISRASAPRLRSRLRDQSAVPSPVSFTDSTKITALKAPAPLPPSPAESDPDGWLESGLQGGTNPNRIPDLGAMAASGYTDPGSIPAWAKGSRASSASDDDSSSPNFRISPRVHRASIPAAAVPQTSSTVPLMIICLALGIVLGALLQSRLGSKACPEPSVHKQQTSSQ